MFLHNHPYFQRIYSKYPPDCCFHHKKERNIHILRFCLKPLLHSLLTLPMLNPDAIWSTIIIPLSGYADRSAHSPEHVAIRNVRHQTHYSTLLWIFLLIRKLFLTSSCRRTEQPVILLSLKRPLDVILSQFDPFASSQPTFKSLCLCNIYSNLTSFSSCLGSSESEANIFVTGELLRILT
jgi:hypothetical protein